ncbi:MAG: M48 family metallopeptidase [Prevotellaceae bacterium]|nr:M48 family metallopeptidase [Prevotella sp.]MDD7257106.1 M48 family metallopeptidase [Prevotellaceae bacterium]MDY6130475.1 M48 family metallopeptidase [Prevotella sp.]
MRRTRFILSTLVVVMMISCGTTSTVPITGRKHRLAVTDEQVLGLSHQEYAKYMKSAKLSTNAANTAMVKRVGQRLAHAVETYLKGNGYAQEVKNFAWEFNLVQGKEVNAFCMPGGKIVVFEGLLPVTRDEASLAIVLGHEIAHAVAKHSAEQMTKSQNASTGLQIGSGVLSAIGVSTTTNQVLTSVAGQGLSLLNLKYSRSNETEADHMGLVFAAMAGYDPNVAVSFWQRMSANSAGTAITWLSSHPSDAQRIADIQKRMPEAMAYYRPAATASKIPATKNGSKKKR